MYDVGWIRSSSYASIDSHNGDRETPREVAGHIPPSAAASCVGARGREGCGRGTPAGRRI